MSTRDTVFVGLHNHQKATVVPPALDLLGQPVLWAALRSETLKRGDLQQSLVAIHLDLATGFV